MLTRSLPPCAHATLDADMFSSEMAGEVGGSSTVVGRPDRYMSMEWLPMRPDDVLGSRTLSGKYGARESLSYPVSGIGRSPTALQLASPGQDQHRERAEGPQQPPRQQQDNELELAGIQPDGDEPQPEPPIVRRESSQVRRNGMKE
jgi:hypothetical protein